MSSDFEVQSPVDLEGEMQKLFLLATIALSGCETSAGQSNEPLPYEGDIKAYVDCSLNNAARVAYQQGDPLSLGIAAEAMCGREKSLLAAAMAKRNGVAFSDRMISKFEVEQAKRNAALIVAKRS